MRADRDREDLTSDHPSTWTPSGGEEKDVDADEGDLSIDSRNVIGNSATSGIDVSVVEADYVTDDGDDELAEKHPDGTPDEESSTAEPVDCPERNRG